MGISKILGSISPAFGAVTGEGVFGDIQKAMGPAAGLVFQAGKAYRDDKKRKATAAEVAAMQKAEFDAKRRGAAGPTMKKGGKLPDLTGDGKVTRADVLKGRGVPGFAKGSKISAAEAVHKHERAKHKGQPLTKMAAGGSASKRSDGCCSKGKTKGRMV
jgi:hypothetical protein